MYCEQYIGRKAGNFDVRERIPRELSNGFEFFLGNSVIHNTFYDAAVLSPHQLEDPVDSAHECFIN
jgi:hypothetical protein